MKCIQLPNSCLFPQLVDVDVQYFLFEGEGCGGRVVHREYTNETKLINWDKLNGNSTILMRFSKDPEETFIIFTTGKLTPLIYVYISEVICIRIFLY